MGILSKIRRHAAIAKGHFVSMFKDVDIPPLPAAVTWLISELNQEEPDVDRLVKLISSETGLASKLIKTANSPLFGLRKPATNVRHVVTLLGFRQVKSIVLAYATMEAVPIPKGDLFDHQAFWTDSLLKAIIARSLSKKRFMNYMDDVFTATILADVAIPVLLTAWGEYYAPIIEEWKNSPRRPSEIEREQFGWDHGQAGAWIVNYWGFPEEMICYIGAHNLSWERIVDAELQNTLALPISIGCLCASVLKPDVERIWRMLAEAHDRLYLETPEVQQGIQDAKETFHEILSLFGLSHAKAEYLMDQIENLVEVEKDGEQRRAL